MVQSLPLAMVVLEGPEGRILQLNRAFTNLFGYTLEDLPTVDAWRLRAYPDPAYRSAMAAEWGGRAQALASLVAGPEPEPEPEPEPLSLAVACKDGSTRFVRAAFAPLEGCLLVTFTDQTEQRRTEDSLHASETLYRELLARQGEGFGMVDQDERFVVANPVAEQIFGVEPGKLAGRSLLEFLEPEAQDDVRHETGLRAQGVSSTYELQIRREDGAPRIILVTATPWLAQGTGDRLTIGVFRDITEQKRAEALLKESEARFRTYVEQSTDVIFTLDAEGTFAFVSPAWERQFGFPPSEAVGRPFGSFVHPEDAVPFASYLRRVLSTGEPGPSPAYRVRHADGSWRWSVANGAAMAVPKGGSRFIGVARDITESRRAEEALARSRAELKAIYDHSPVMMCVADSQHRVLYVNPAFTAFTGTAQGDLAEDRPGGVLGCIRALSHPHGCESGPNCQSCALRSALDATFLTGETQHNIEFRTSLLRGGVLREVALWASTSLFEASGEKYLLLCLNDITGRKAAEEALKASEARYRDQFNLASEGIYTLSPEGMILEVNESSARMHGRSPADMRGLKLVELCAPQAADLTGRRLRRILAGEALTYQVDHLHQDGHTFTLEVSASLITEAGQPRILVFHRDITDRMRVEEALRENEEQLRTIFEASEAGIILVSPDGRIQFANRRMAELFGLSMEGLIGSSYLDHLHPSELGQGDQRMRSLMEGAVSSVSVERRYLRADGTDFWGHLSGRRLLHPDGSLRALLGIVTDITQRRQAEAEQQSLQAQLHQAQKMESLGSLAGGVAHDMNNVLGAILGLASAHLDSQAPGSPARRAFGTIIQAAERGGVMLKSLLSFARQNTAEKRELDLNAIIREEVHLLERTTLSKVRLILELAPDLRPIRGDAGALTHALMNLCVNAVDAMSERGTLTFRTRHAEPDWVEVQVEDTGTGMPKEVLEKALDPFFTTKEVGKGTGLGLSIVYSTVKAHQGQMELRSEPGQGTCVIMRFPACAAPLAAVEASGAHRLTRPVGASLKVLLVDDDELIQTAMMGLLELLGHKASVVPSGEEALVQIEAGLRPDVVILDMNMPGLGGLGTLPRLRALLPEAPVLLATGRADQAALNLVDAYPHVSLLAKPFGMKDLEASLAPFLRR